MIEYKTGLAASIITAALLLAPAQQVRAQDADKPAPSRLDSENYKSGRAVLKVFRPVVAKTSRSTVRVKADGKVAALGTIVGADGYIITKASELEGEVTCRLRNGDELVADVVGVDRNNDLALLKIDPTDQKFQPVEWADEVPPIGSWAITAGPRVDPVSIGVVSVNERRIKDKRVLLGVMLSEQADERGPKVQSVVPGMGAAKAGLQANDIVLKANDKQVKDRDELMEVLKSFGAGDVVGVEILRGQETLELEIELKTDDTILRGRQGIQNRLAGALSERNYGFESVFQHDTVIKPSDCGSPIVGLDGKVIGINIARAGRVASYALPSKLVLEKIAAIKSAAINTVTAEDEESPKSE